MFHTLNHAQRQNTQIQFQINNVLRISTFIYVFAQKHMPPIEIITRPRLLKTNDVVS